MHIKADTRDRARRVSPWPRRSPVAVALLSFLLASCVTTQPAPSMLGEPVVPPGATVGAPAVPAPATPDTPPKAPGACRPDPFCMLDCKKQDYPSAYCNLRCGC